MVGRRRGNREGSIRKRRKVRADGSVYTWYEGSVMVGRKADGSEDRRTVTGQTREEVVAKIATLVSKRSQRALVPADRITITAYLEAWFEDHKRFGGRSGNGLAPKTEAIYRALLTHHIEPRIGHLPLQKVTPDDLKQLYHRMMTEPGPKKRPVGVRVCEQAHNLLHKAFSDAVLEGKLLVNPCDRVPNPPRTRYRAEDRPWLERDEVPKVLEHVRNTRYYLPFLVAMAAGLRRNEVLGLTWDRIDLKAGVIDVRQQWGKHRDGSWGLRVPKTKAGIRPVPIPSDVVDALAAHQVTQQAQYGKKWRPRMLVFDRGDGRPIAPSDFTHAWARVRKALELPGSMRLHDLRGSYITWLAERGVDPKTIATLVGHADIQVTARIYERVTARMIRKAARAVEGLTKPKKARQAAKKR